MLQIHYHPDGKVETDRSTVGIYFMYDVKQFVPEEWSSPPLEAKLVQHPGLGTVCMGRGAVNQKGPENSFLSALMAFKAAGLIDGNLARMWRDHREVRRYRRKMKSDQALAALTGPPDRWI